MGDDSRDVARRPRVVGVLVMTIAVRDHAMYVGARNLAESVFMMSQNPDVSPTVRERLARAEALCWRVVERHRPEIARAPVEIALQELLTALADPDDTDDASVALVTATDRAKRALAALDCDSVRACTNSVSRPPLR